jgi:transcriptional regulator with XRE-family HTH domain
MRPAYYIRLATGETVAQVAEATGLNRKSVTAFERGETTAHGPTVKALAEHYGVPVRELFEEPEASIPPAA